MKQTLINKYLAGETNISEERELKQLLLDIPDTQQSKAERSILELLSYSESEEVEEDIFAVDYTEEYDKHVRPSRTIRLWPWFAAACVAALLVVFLAPPKEEDKQVAKVEDSIPIKVKELDTMKSEPLLPLAHESLIAQVTNTKPSSVEQIQNEQMSVSAEDTFETQQYALSLDENEDDYVIQASTASQDPNLVTKFVGKLVETCKAKKIELDCSNSSDKNASTDIYVFKEDERIDVFGRLIQVACWYDNTQPGYHLNLSNNQFIFELQDRQNNIQHLWFAERVRDNIILTCTRATVGSQILSPCYRQFRRNFKNNYSM